MEDHFVYRDMVSLEVGDEVYAFEKYTPKAKEVDGVWYRGSVQVIQLLLIHDCSLVMLSALQVGPLLLGPFQVMHLLQDLVYGHVGVIVIKHCCPSADRNKLICQIYLAVDLSWHVSPSATSPSPHIVVPPSPALL